MSTPLHSHHCVPCEGGTAPLTTTEEDLYHEQTRDWTIVRDGVHLLRRSFERKDFVDALLLISIVGEIAEEEGHHPDIHLTQYRHVTIELTTHAISGLSVNDFIVASKIDQALAKK